MEIYIFKDDMWMKLTGKNFKTTRFIPELLFQQQTEGL